MSLTTLHVTNAWHPTSGGIRTFYLAMLDAANRDERRVVVVAPGPKHGSEAVGRYGHLHFVAAPPAPAFDRRYRMIGPRQYLPGLSGRLARILEHERPDVVEISDKYSLPYLAGVLRKGWLPRVGRPALVGLSCERLDDNMAAYVSAAAPARRFTRWYVRNVYGPPFDVHVANSEYTAAELRLAMPERPPSFVRVCPMGVDVSGFAPGRGSRATRAQLLRRLGGDPSTTLLLYAGRLSPEKNIGLLIDTMRQLTSPPSPQGDFRLVVAGDGPLSSWLRARAADELQGRVLMLGNLDRHALAACCASCDVFVHPNPREPFGIGPLEAMASGTPVVVPDRGGVTTYANDANAWLAAPTASAFSAAIIAAARKDPGRLARARSTADAFCWEAATRRYFALYDDIHRSIVEIRPAHDHHESRSDQRVRAAS